MLVIDSACLGAAVERILSLPPTTSASTCSVVPNTSSMAALMPQVLAPLGEVTGAIFELLPLTNTLFGPTVTCAGLLPGRVFRDALATRTDLDLVLIPAESLNDDGLFMDDMTLLDLQGSVPVPVRPSYCFTDALETPLRP